MLPVDADQFYDLPRAGRLLWADPERLAPPSFAARRTARPCDLLPAARLLTADEAARALFRDRARLARLDADGTLPALRIDGAPCFDADLVEALADDEAGGARGAPAPPPARLSRADGFTTIDD